MNRLHFVSKVTSQVIKILMNPRKSKTISFGKDGRIVTRVIANFFKRSILMFRVRPLQRFRLNDLIY